MKTRYRSPSVRHGSFFWRLSGSGVSIGTDSRFQAGWYLIVAVLPLGRILYTHVYFGIIFEARCLCSLNLKDMECIKRILSYTQALNLFRALTTHTSVRRNEEIQRKNEPTFIG